MSEEREERVTSSTEACPACGANWVGGEIPVEDRHMYVTARWMRQIACYDRERDITTHYICPDCGEHFRRAGT